MTQREKNGDQRKYGMSQAIKLFSRKGKLSIEQKLKKRVQKTTNVIKGFRYHLSVYGVINTFLFAINMMTSSHILWFIYPLGGWGIALGTHFSQKLAARLVDRIQTKIRRPLQLREGIETGLSELETLKNHPLFSIFVTIKNLPPTTGTVYHSPLRHLALSSELKLMFLKQPNYFYICCCNRFRRD